MRTRTHKLVAYYNDPVGQPGAFGPVDPPEWERYDLAADPREVQNLIESPEHASLRAELRRLPANVGDEPHPAVADGPPA